VVVPLVGNEGLLREALSSLYQRRRAHPRRRAPAVVQVPYISAGQLYPLHFRRLLPILGAPEGSEPVSEPSQLIARRYLHEVRYGDRSDLSVLHGMRLAVGLLLYLTSDRADAQAAADTNPSRRHQQRQQPAQLVDVGIAIRAKAARCPPAVSS